MQQLGIQLAAGLRFCNRIFGAGKQNSYRKTPGDQLPQGFCAGKQFLLLEKKCCRHGVALQHGQQAGQGLGGKIAVFIRRKHFRQAGEQQRRGARRHDHRIGGHFNAAGLISGASHRAQSGSVAGQNHIIGKRRLITGQSNDWVAYTRAFR